MKPLSGLDGAFLHLETPETPMHVGSLHLFDLPPGYQGDFHAAVKRLITRRLHLAPVFRRKLAPMPLQFANPAWIRDDAPDMDYHVQRITLPPPGTLAQLEDCTGRLHSELLDRSRPLWRIYVIDGLASGQAGYYVKVHHAVLDGQAGVLLTQTLFDLTPRPRSVPRPRGRSAAEDPGLGELAVAALRHDAGQYLKLIRHLPQVVRTLVGLLGKAGGEAPGTLGQNFSFGPRTPLNAPITGERRFAALSLPLDALKQLAAQHEAKLNDVVLALCSGALRRYLAHHGGIPRKPLTAAMPISLRAAGNTEMTTQATMTLVSLQTQLKDPIEAAARHPRRRRRRQGADRPRTRHPAHRLPDDRHPLGAARPGLAVRAHGTGGPDPADRQRRRLQRAGPAGAAVCRRHAHGDLLAAVDRRARRRPERHGHELCRRDGLRLHRGAQRGARCTPARGGAGRSLRRTGGRIGAEGAQGGRPATPRRPAASDTHEEGAHRRATERPAMTAPSHPMSRVDTAWLRMDSDVNLMMIVGVWLLRPAIRYDALCRRIQDRLLVLRTFPPEGRAGCAGFAVGGRRAVRSRPPRGGRKTPAPSRPERAQRAAGAHG